MATYVLDPGKTPLYIATNSAGLSIWNGTSFTNKTTSDGMSSNNVRGLCTTTDGKTYIGYSDAASVDIWNGTSFTNKFSGFNGVRRIAVGTDGKIYFASVNGLRIYDPGLDTFAAKYNSDGLVSNDVQDVAVASDGLVYIAATGGLSIWNGTSFTNKTTSDGLLDTNLATVCVGLDGKVYIGYFAYVGISIWDGSSFTHKTTSDGLVNNFCYTGSIAAGSDGKIYIGTDGGLSIWNGTSFTNKTTSDGLVNNTISGGIAVASDGKIYIGTGGGLSIWNGTSFTNKTTSNGMPSDYVTAVALKRDVPAVPTNVVLVGGKVVGETNVDPTAEDVKYGDPLASLPVGSVLRQTNSTPIAGKKFLKFDTGVRDFTAIPPEADPDWDWAAGADDAWLILQAK